MPAEPCKCSNHLQHHQESKDSTHHAHLDRRRHGTAVPLVHSNQQVPQTPHLRGLSQGWITEAVIHFYPICTLKHPHANGCRLAVLVTVGCNGLGSGLVAAIAPSLRFLLRQPLMSQCSGLMAEAYSCHMGEVRLVSEGFRYSLRRDCQRCPVVVTKSPRDC